jgi:hypothetical protein
MAARAYQRGVHHSVHGQTRRFLPFLIPAGLAVGLLTGCGQESTPDAALTSSVEISKADLAGARAGLGRYLTQNRPESSQTSTDIPGCPALSQERLEDALEGIGVSTTFKDWGTEIEWNEYEELNPDLLGIACGGDSDGNANDGDTEAGIIAVDLIDKATDKEFLTWLKAEMPKVSTQKTTGIPGSTTMGSCQTIDGSTACIEVWAQDSFLIGISIMGVDRAQTTQVLSDIIPDVITTLADQPAS